MSETLPVEDVQAWIDDSTISCGDCGASSFTVQDTKYSQMMESFDKVSPHRVEMECNNCGTVTENSLMQRVVDTIQSD